MSDLACTPNGRVETILLVEDEDALLSLMQDVLKDAGYNVMTASDGQEAAESYCEHGGEIDLVLTDIGLPRLGGRELLRRLRQINPEVRVVVSSGFADGTVKGDFLSAGAKDLVPKPFHPAQILEVVRSVLDASVSSNGGSK